MKSHLTVQGWTCPVSFRKKIVGGRWTTPYKRVYTPLYNHIRHALYSAIFFRIHCDLRLKYNTVNRYTNFYRRIIVISNYTLKKKFYIIFHRPSVVDYVLLHRRFGILKNNIIAQVIEFSSIGFSCILYNSIYETIVAYNHSNQHYVNSRSKNNVIIDQKTNRTSEPNAHK